MNEANETPAWYRYFWPWFVLLLLGSAVTASLYTLYLAASSNDSLVVDGQDGTDVVSERHRTAQLAAAELGLAATLRVNRQTLGVHITLGAGRLETMPTTLDLWISHPTFADRDQRTTLTAAMTDGNGRPRWSGFLKRAPVGRHYVVLSEGDNWRLNGVWNGEPSVRLSPAGPVPGD